jgi:short-subunit dehydrogenase
MKTKVALITGATSGIGASFARYYAGKGYDLILTGRRKNILTALADEVSKKYNAKTEIIFAELSKPKFVDAIVKKIKAVRNIEVLVNNAGYGSSVNFDQDTIESQLRMMAVHNEAPVRLSHAVLSQMMKNKKGFIINVSSVASFIPTPQDILYGTTKAFLNNFSESLAVLVKPHGIKVQALCPGFTRTDFHEKLGWERKKLENRGLLKWMSADQVVKSSVRCIRKNKPLCVPGFTNKILYFIIKLMPVNLLCRLMGRMILAGK